MSITLSNEFTVEGSADDTFALLVDVERVAPCIPGAEITGADDDGGYAAQMTMRIGPMKMGFVGHVRVADRDERERTAVMYARGRERRGQGTADATMRMRVAPEQAGSHVTIDSDVKVGGRLAQMGGGVMADVAGRMVADMAKALEATLRASGPATRPRGTSDATVQTTEVSTPSVAAPVPSLAAVIGTVLMGRGRAALRRAKALAGRRS